VHPQEFLDRSAQRLHADGAQVSSVPLPGGMAVVGQRSEFKVRWFLTTLHLYTVVAAAPQVDAAVLATFTDQALEYAVQQRKGLRGMQSGVAVIPVLGGGIVSPDAAAFAHDRLVRRFAATAWPAVVDLGTGATASHRGRVLLGGVYSGWLRERTAVVLA